MITLGALLVGTMVGSFLNVVVTRLPRKESLVAPGSHCRECGAPIRWCDNVPLLSFLWLRGRCRNCGSPIGWRYPAVEAATGAVFAVSAVRFGATLELLPALLFLSALVAITAIDLEHQLIPDVITVPGIVAGLLISPALSPLPWADALLGALLGGGIFFLIILLSRGGMGGGDMKLAAMMGAFLGWKLALVALFLGVFLGGGVAVALLVSGRRGRKDPVPFGPFLAAGSALSLFWGERLLRWYLGGFR